jgi:hypothetical protein
MARVNGGGLARWAGGVVMALLLCETVAVSPAYAGCGNHFRPPRSVAFPPEFTRRQTPQRPCTGPACSRPGRSLLAPVAPQRDTTDLCPALADADQAGRHPGRWVRRNDRANLPRFTTPVYHPPR